MLAFEEPNTASEVEKTDSSGVANPGSVLTNLASEVTNIPIEVTDLTSEVMNIDWGNEYCLWDGGEESCLLVDEPWL